jgi:hypothetical protein
VPLKVGLSAETVKAALTVSKKERPLAKTKHEIKYSVWCTHNDTHPSMRRTVVLTNETKAALSFVLSTEKVQAEGEAATTAACPFAVEACKMSKFARESALSRPADRDPAASMSATAARTASLRNKFVEGKIYALPSRSSMEVTVRYRWRPGDRLRAQMGEDGQALLRYGDRGRLKVGFSNGTFQWIDLEAEVHRPALVVTCSAASQSREEAKRHDFGVCHVTNSVPVEVSVGNPTPVDAEWNVRHVPAVGGEDGAADVPGVFNFSAISGTLSGPTIPQDSGLIVARPPRGASAFIRGMPLKLTIQFNPEKEMSYRSTFRFQVKKGNSYDVTLSGKGTFDESFIVGTASMTGAQ